jgi:phosphoglycolate phosphatase-like HAD superfamily hydrolase
MKLAIFDWNGTLIDDAEANWQASNETFKIFNRTPLTFEQYQEMMDFPILHFYVRAGISADEYLGKFEEASGAFINHYKNLAMTRPLRRGATELFDWLLDQDYKLMILSNFVQHELDAQIAHYHIGHYFTHVSGNYAFNETEHSRTNKLERLVAYLKDKEIDKSASFIIGDSLEEPDLAHRLNLRAFSVSWGCFSRARLQATTTEAVIDELADIKEKLLKE